MLWLHSLTEFPSNPGREGLLSTLDRNEGAGALGDKVTQPRPRTWDWGRAKVPESDYPEHELGLSAVVGTSEVSSVSVRSLCVVRVWST